MYSRLKIHPESNPTPRNYRTKRNKLNNVKRKQLPESRNVGVQSTRHITQRFQQVNFQHYNPAEGRLRN